MPSANRCRTCLVLGLQAAVPACPKPLTLLQQPGVFCVLGVLHPDFSGPWTVTGEVCVLGKRRHFRWAASGLATRALGLRLLGSNSEKSLEDELSNRSTTVQLRRRRV